MAEAQAVAELVAEKRKLKKSLFRFDMIFFTVCAIVALDTIGQSSSYGAQAILWLIVSAVTFLIPYGLITAELGAAFPTEGATYDWVRLAYGHFAGAVVGVLYWLSNPIWLGGTLAATTIAALDALWGSSLGGNQFWETVIGFFFIWGAVTMNILSLRYMKWVPNLGAIIRLALLAFFALLVIVSGTQHGFHGTLAGFLPTDTTVLIGVIGVIVFQWIGFELQTNASEEMDNPQRDIPRAVYASGVISFLGYAIPIVGVVLILSSDELSNVSGFVAAYQFASSSVLGGAAPFFNHLAALAFVFVLLSSGTTWLMGSDRLMAIGALAGSLHDHLLLHPDLPLAAHVAAQVPEHPAPLRGPWRECGRVDLRHPHYVLGRGGDRVLAVARAVHLDLARRLLGRQPVDVRDLHVCDRCRADRSGSRLLGGWPRPCRPHAAHASAGRYGAGSCHRHLAVSQAS
ncbi:MAG: APC family permease [Chloroflexi bacterium]|nr:MAG: APC family permease [Chloroflexota bacterium]